MKNIILKTVTWFFVILACLSACALDSEAWWIPTIAFLVSMCWLIPFGFANGFLKKENTYDYYR